MEPPAASQAASQQAEDAGHWFRPPGVEMLPAAGGATEPGDLERPRRGGSIFSSCAGAAPFRAASGCALAPSASVEQAVGANTNGSLGNMPVPFANGAGSLPATASSCAAPSPPPQAGKPVDGEQHPPASLLASLQPSLQQPTPPNLPDSAFRLMMDLLPSAAIVSSAFRLMMDVLPSAVIVKDAVGNVIYSNRAAQHAIGLTDGTASSILGWQIAPLVPVEQLPLQIFPSTDQLPPLPPARALRVSLMDHMCIARGEMHMFHMPFFFSADGPQGSDMRQAAALFIEQTAPAGLPLSHQ